MRRLSERARLEGMLALRKALDGVRRGQHAALARAAVPLSETDRPDADGPDAVVYALLAEDDIVTDDPAPVLPDRETELTKGLDRIVESLERVAAQLDSYHRERAEHLDAIEFLLRETLIGTLPAAASRPIVLGGVIDSEEREISLVADDDVVALGVDAAVEVRSRFHDRWIGGFTIAETVNTPGRRRYRLRRRSDGIPLPILFDACDVRAAEDAFSRQHAPS